ncbi:MAG: enoyl-CoA hydratase/isomerase family protein [Microthrixaceae bacterium]
MALVVTGSGKFFSNGLDLDWMSEHPDDSAEMLRGVHRLLGRMLLLDMYTVAAINGHAFAGGAMLTCGFDERVMRGGPRLLVPARGRPRPAAHTGDVRHRRRATSPTPPSTSPS